MELNEFLSLAGRKKATVLSWVILFLALAIIFTAIQPFKYGAKSKLLVVQSYDGIVDPYAASRSNEYLSNILASMVSSESFFYEVVNSGFYVDQSYFSQRADKRLREWNKTVDAKAVNDTGVIIINVYHRDKYQAEQIASAVNYVMKVKNGLYHGAGERVSVRVVDPPIVSRFPVKPNVVLNVSLAIILGPVFGLCYIYLLPEEKYSLRFWSAFAHRRWRAAAGNSVSASETDSRSGANKEDEGGGEKIADVLATEEMEEAEEKYEKEINEAAAGEQEAAETENIDPEEVDDLDSGQLTYEDIVKQGNIKNIL